MEKAVSWKKILILAIAVCLFAGIIVKCNQFQKTPLASYKGQKYEKAVVTKIIKDNLAEDGSRYGTQKVLVKITTGTYKGKEKQAINPSGTLFGADCKVGARIIVIVNKSGTNAGFTVYSQDRTMAIYGFAFACIIGIMFPIMYRGISPIVTLGLLGGYSSKTVSAILGTAIGVVIAAVAAMAFGKAAGITGYNVSDIEALNYVGQNTKIKIGELLFAGIIISALGAVMDVGMSIASTIMI